MTEIMRALVVDDDPSVAWINATFAGQHPSVEVVATVATGAEALGAYRRLSPDLILLDVYLPDISGLDVLRAIRSMPGDGPEVVLVTAARDLDSVRQARAHGVKHYLVKPFTGEELRSRLGLVVEEWQRLRRDTGSGALSQELVDRVIGGPAAVQPPEVDARHDAPKGLSGTTLARVIGALEGARAPESAANIALAVGLSRVSARRYLEHLVLHGRAGVVPRYGGSGRPVNLYHPIGAPGGPGPDSPSTGIGTWMAT